MIQSIGVLDFKVLIYRKSIKNIYLRVDPLDGSVKISAPKRMALATVRAYVVENEYWIRRRQSEHLLLDGLKPYRHLVTGEHVPFWGKCYPLELNTQASTSRIVFDSDHFVIQEQGGGCVHRRLKKLDHWYRRHLLKAGMELIGEWEQTIGVSIKGLTIRKMKTLWGSCNIVQRRICLNRELIKLHPDCLEGVVVHEMTHLHERCHTERFYQLLGRYLPDWQARDRRLHAEMKALGGLHGQ